MTSDPCRPSVTDVTGGPSWDTAWSPGPRDEVGARGLVARPRVTERLRAGAQGRLVLLTAPAGFGKTVALTHWAEQHRGGPVAWLTPHPDDDPSRLAARLVAALERSGAAIRPATSAHVQHRGPVIGRRFLAALVADLVPISDAILVVDGLDAPLRTGLVEALVALIEGLPEGLNVMVASRSRWPTSGHGSWRPGQVVRLDQADLAFTPDEARLLLEQVSGRRPTDRQAETLLARTEGWPAGLQLAAVALRHAPDPDRFVDGFAGDERHVAGFLRDEVLAHQPAHVRRFLARTSVVDRLSGPLCDALTGDDDGAAMLRHLERHGLFTRAVGPGRGRFAYHPLFRDLLRHELRHDEPEAEAPLLVRAASWHLARDEPEPAADHLIEARAWQQLIELIDRYGGRMFENGAVHSVLRWLDALPGGRNPRRPDLAVRRAYLHTMLGDTRLADRVLRDAETDPPRPGEQLAVNALRATWAFFDASPSPVISAADAVLAAVDDVDPDEIPDVFGITAPASLRTMAAGSRARALWYLGDVDASRRAFAAVLQQRDIYPPWHVHALGALALLEAWAGNLRVADGHARRALAVATDAGVVHHPATMDARLAAAHVSRERGHLHRADVLLNQAHTIATGTRRPITLAVHAVERALWHLAADRPDRGLAELDRHRTSGNPPPPQLIDHRRRAVEARLLLATGDCERARSSLGLDDDTEGWSADLAAVAVQTSVMRHDFATAQACLDRWPATGAAEPHARLERELWTAVVAARAGERRRALELASAVVAEAEAEGHVRLFLDGGPPAERMLRELCRAAPTAYLRHVVRGAAPTPHQATGGATADLTQRELEVLRYLPTSLSSAEIAARLYISLNTLKTHLRAIYRKLGVDGRHDAIRRAVDRGIA